MVGFVSGVLQQSKEIKEDEVGATTLSLKTRGIVFKCNYVLGEVSGISALNCKIRFLLLLGL